MSDVRTQLNELRHKLESLEALRDEFGDEVVDQKKAELEARIKALVDTGGGAFVAGDVEAGEDFVGRDKWQVILGDQYVSRAPDEVAPEMLLRAYLRSLAADCRRLPLGVVDPRFLQTKAETPLSLSDVYVDMDVLAPVRIIPSAGS